MRSLTGLLGLLKNTGLYCFGMLEKIFLKSLGFANKIFLLKRQILLVNIEDDVDSIPRNTWRIPYVILQSDQDQIFKDKEKIQATLSLLRQRFPRKLIFVRYPDCFKHAAFNKAMFLKKLSDPSMDLKSQACLSFAKHLSLRDFLETYPFIKLYQSPEKLSKKILNYRVKIYGAVACLVLSLSVSGLFFDWVYRVNMSSMDEAKTLSQRLVQVYEDPKLSDTQKFQFFQRYYFFSKDFPREQALFTFVISEQLKDSMENLLFTIIQKQYYQRLVHDLKSKLIVFRQTWPSNKNIRGEYYADWLAYLDLLYPSHLMTSAVELQVKMVFDSIDRFSTELGFVKEYLRYLKQTQGSSNTLIADSFFTSISAQLSSGSIEDLYAFIRFLEFKQLGTVTLEYFFKKSDILWSDSLLPAMFLKENFLNILLPQLQKLSQDSGSYTWFMGAGLLDQQALFDTLKQEFVTENFQAWRDFLSSVNLRATNSLLLASNFLELLRDEQGDFKQLLATANKNLNIEGLGAQLSVDWKSYDKAMDLLYQDSHYLLLNENTSVAAKDYALNVLTKGDTHLNQAAQWVTKMAASLPDPNLALGLQEYLLAPLRFYWMTLLMNAKDNLDQQYRTQILNGYQQHLQNKFPFSNSTEDAVPADVKNYLAPTSGLFWQFLRNNLQGFVVLKKEWQLNTWLGLGLPVDLHFIDKTNQLWQFANDVFNQDDYHLALSLYPIPSPAIESESLSIADKLFSYQNGPQIWQSFIWQPDSPENLLTVQYTDHDTVFKQTFTGHWGLLRFLLNPSLDNKAIVLRVKPDNLVTVLQNLPRDNGLLLMRNSDDNLA